MKKILIIAVSLILFLFSASACNNAGDTKDCIRTTGSSTLYTEDDINKIMDIVENYFIEKFEGCSLLELRYDEEYSDKCCGAWANQYDADRAIVFKSDFYVSPTGGDGSLNQDSTYKDWEWILTQNDGEEWTLRTWGY
ncbi:MAG: hypothetical protein IKJ88_03900 [Clostridia bacterium]|nr:hypothetical protein [Clostridia bacterium]